LAKEKESTLIKMKMMNEEKTTPVIEKLIMLQKCWTKQKPDYACIFLTKNKKSATILADSEYNIWCFCWEIGEPPVDVSDEGITYWYLAWTDQEGNEWDDIAECDFDEYLILELLPTMDEVHEQYINKLK